MKTRSRSTAFLTLFLIIAYSANFPSSLLAQGQTGIVAAGPSHPLVAAYGLNEGAGATVTDGSGNGNTGTITGASWTDGRFGNALIFDGQTNWVTIPDSDSLDLSSAMTVEAWLYSIDLTSFWGTIALKEAPPGNNLSYHLEVDPSNHPITFITTDVGGLHGVAGPQPVTLNTWTHLAGTYDGTTLSLYINGQLVASEPVSGNIIRSTGPLRLGGNSIWGEFIRAKIDEVRIYDRALSQGEIQFDMNTPVIDPSPTPTATATATSPSQTATPSPTAAPTVTPNPLPAQSVNLSTRLQVRTDDSVGIGGFITGPSASKQVLLRAIGPSLSQFGIPNALADTIIELHGPTGFSTIVNDDWRDTQEADIIATGLPPTNDFESAILATLPPGNYTAVVRGKNNTIGVGLIEIYDLTPTSSQLGNISTRAFVGTSADVVIGGFILSYGNNSQIHIGGLGPSLAQFGINPVLADPSLELRDNNGALLAANDNCGESSMGTVTLESCIDTTLSAGTYTTILAGHDGGMGIGLVEIYNLN